MNRINRANAQSVWSAIGFSIGIIGELANGGSLLLDYLVSGLISALIFLLVVSFYLWMTKDEDFLSLEPPKKTLKVPEGAYLAKFCNQCKRRVYDPFDECLDCKNSDLIRKFVKLDDRANVDAPDYFPENKTCPKCISQIKFEATKCKYCASEV